MSALHTVNTSRDDCLTQLPKILALGAVLAASSTHAFQYESFNDGMSPAINWSEVDVTAGVNGGGPYASWSNPVDPDNAGEFRYRILSDASTLPPGSFFPIALAQSFGTESSYLNFIVAVDFINPDPDTTVGVLANNLSSSISAGVSPTAFTLNQTVSGVPATLATTPVSINGSVKHRLILQRSGGATDQLSATLYSLSGTSAPTLIATHSVSNGALSATTLTAGFSVSSTGSPAIAQTVQDPRLFREHQGMW